MIQLLAVDDEPVNLAIIVESLSEENYQIDKAGDGEAAWTLMQSNSYDVIMLDRMMPKLDGLSLLKRIKADPRWAKTPVIMQTAAATQQQVHEGLEAGAYYYLTKPYEPQALHVLVTTVVTDLLERRKLNEASIHLKTIINLLDHCEFTFRTLDDARNMAAALANLCLDGSGSSMGLAELLVNAVEHGNLGITYAEKARLRESFSWEQEITRRLDAAPWRQRRARIRVQRDADWVEFTITDEGDGFDWNPYLEFDPRRAFDLNGRGIAMARQLGFDSIDYQGKGNIVVARTRAVASS